MGTFLLVLIVAVVIVFVLRSTLAAPKYPAPSREELEFSMLAPQAQRIIDESLEIINRTKNVETGIGRFDTIKEHTRRLLELAPAEGTVSLEVNGRALRTLGDLHLLDEAKENWLDDFFKERVETAIRQADLLTDPKLQKAQIKKALSLALKAFEFLPANPRVRERVSEIESRLLTISEQGSPRRKGKNLD